MLITCPQPCPVSGAESTPIITTYGHPWLKLPKGECTFKNTTYSMRSKSLMCRSRKNGAAKLGVGVNRDMSRSVNDGYS